MSAVICVIGNRKLSPLEAAPAHSTGHPEGGRHGCRPFSDQAMDGLSENGDGTPHALSDFDVTRKAVFFGYFLLGQQKKVPRPQGRNEFDLALYDTQNEMEFRQEGRRAFAFRRVTFFAGAKKVTKESTFLDKSLKASGWRRNFRTRASCLGPKMATAPHIP